jgi:hypothetical protein
VQTLGNLALSGGLPAAASWMVVHVVRAIWTTAFGSRYYAAPPRTRRLPQSAR